MSRKKKLRKQIDTLIKVIGDLQDDMADEVRYAALFIKYMSDTLEEPSEDLIRDFEEWAAYHGHKTVIHIEEDTKEDSPPLWSIEEVLDELNPPEEPPEEGAIE